MSLRPIKITIFIHQDLAGYNEDTLYMRHFWWVDEEIPRISGRDMDILFVAPSAAPSISSLDYKTDDLGKLLETLQNEVNAYVETLERDGAIHKYLLLTKDDLNDRILGVAYTPGAVGVASLTDRITATHEIGHMFDAKHEDADENVKTYTGIYNTTMFATADKPTAFRFSKKNQENIRRYLAQYH